MTKESSPWWVWLTVVLLVFGAIAYMAVFSGVEYLMTFF
jgi:hypothetical protein